MMNYKYDPYRDTFTRIDEPPTEEQYAEYICTNCGKGFSGMGLAHIMESFIYCPYCGIKLEEEPKKEPKMNEVEEMRLNAETEEKTTYAFITSTENHTMIEGYVKTWWTENGVIGVTFVSDNTYITGANNVLIQETK